MMTSVVWFRLLMILSLYTLGECLHACPRKENQDEQT